MSKNLKEAKTVFVGLDNVGKTSIINFLEKKLVKGQKSIKPTVGADISSQKISLLGVEIYHWDLGGQDQYRKQYLSSKDKYFLGVKLIIFVIDIQDAVRFDEALEYLKSILNLIKDINKELKIFIMFHKYDPIISTDKDTGKKATDLEKRIREFCPYKDISFFKSSIYNGISLIKPFSKVAIFFSEKSQLIQDQLNLFCTNTKSRAAILFDTRNFVLDSEAVQEDVVDALEVVAQSFSRGMEKLEEYFLETLEIVTTVRHLKSEKKDLALIFIQKLDLDIKLFLVTLSGDPQTKYLIYDNMKKLLENLIKIFEK